MALLDQPVLMRGSGSGSTQPGASAEVRLAYARGGVLDRACGPVDLRGGAFSRDWIAGATGMATVSCTLSGTASSHRRFDSLFRHPDMDCRLGEGARLDGRCNCAAGVEGP